MERKDGKNKEEEEKKEEVGKRYIICKEKKNTNMEVKEDENKDNEQNEE